MQQQQFETDEDYLARLEDEASKEYDDTIDNQRANEYNIKLLKDNLKTITRDVADIDAIVSHFSPEDIYHVNKYWALIKKTYEELHGTNNRNIDYRDIISVIINLLFMGKHGPGEKDTSLDNVDDDYPIMHDLKLPEDPLIQDETLVPELRPTKGPLKNPALIGELQERLKKREEFDPYENLRPLEPDENNAGYETIGKFRVEPINSYVLYVLNNDTDVRFYLRRGSQQNIFVSKTFDAKNQYIVGGAKGGQKYPNNGFLKWLGEYTGAFQYPDVDINTLFDNERTKRGIYTELVKRIKTRTEERDVTVDGKEVKGYGMPLEVHRGLVDFGKNKINLYKLYYDNILVVKNPGKGNVNGFKNSRVSDNFVDIIMAVVKKQPVPKQSLKMLSSGERETYDLLMTMSGLHRSESHNGDDKTHINNLKERLSRIESEIMAGNDNASLLKELHEILMRLHYFKVITVNQALKHYNDIKKMYFLKK
jgi:hypothetical protein